MSEERRIRTRTPEWGQASGSSRLSWEHHGDRTTSGRVFPVTRDRQTDDVPVWALVSSAAAPVLLIGGWTLAAALQPAGFDQVSATISDLAGLAATDRWVMTAALVGVGASHLTTALGLHPADRLGRAALALAGVATVAVAAVPVTTGGTPTAHTIAAGAAFLSLTLFPTLASGSARSTPALLRPTAGVLATATLAVALGWFAFELSTGGARIGLSERVSAGAQSLWPLAVVVSSRAERRSRSRHG